MSEWREVAKVPDEQFEAAFAKGGRPSVAEDQRISTAVISTSPSGPDGDY
jgi:hypothetical protein